MNRIPSESATPNTPPAAAKEDDNLMAPGSALGGEAKYRGNLTTNAGLLALAGAENLKLDSDGNTIHRFSCFVAMLPGNRPRPIADVVEKCESAFRVAAAEAMPGVEIIRITWTHIKKDKV